jgi:hypothetical protein
MQHSRYGISTEKYKLVVNKVSTYISLSRVAYGPQLVPIIDSRISTIMP